MKQGCPICGGDVVGTQAGRICLTPERHNPYQQGATVLEPEPPEPEKPPSKTELLARAPDLFTLTLKELAERAGLSAQSVVRARKLRLQGAQP